MEVLQHRIAVDGEHLGNVVDIADIHAKEINEAEAVPGSFYSPRMLLFSIPAFLR